jgi:hypothetical protein
MPPPNHQTGASPSFSATKKRTFMCAVGQYGLRGCSTSETPIASQRRPASSGRWAVAEAGICSPLTCEKLTPPRSNSVPSSIRREIPPPPCGPVPGVAQEGLAFERFEFADDAVLQSGEIVPDRGDVHQASGSFIASTLSLWRVRKSSSFLARVRP